MIEKSIKNGVRIYQKRPRTDKNKSIINTSNKIISAIKIFKSMIDNDEFRIPGEYYAKPNNNIDLSWINDPDGYEEIAEEVGAYHTKGKNNNELKLVKGFITKINSGTINNKNKAANEFRKLKQKVTNDILRQVLIKYLGRYLFGENYDELDEEDRELLRNMNKEVKGLKILTNKQMLNRLPILLAQIQAGNNSNKLKNEIRQILYSLYRSKVLTKPLYNNLIKSIRA